MSSQSTSKTVGRIIDVLVPVALDQAYTYRVPAGLELALGDLVTARRDPACTTASRT
jgi:primosomal protein N' (replication factor Y)